MIKRDNSYISEIKKGYDKLVSFLDNFRMFEEFEEGFKNLLSLRNRISELAALLNTSSSSEFTPWQGYENFSLASKEGENALLGFAEEFCTLTAQYRTDLTSFQSLREERKKEVLSEIFSKRNEEIIRKLHAHLENLDRIFVGNVKELFFQGWRAEKEIYGLSKRLKAEETAKNSKKTAADTKITSKVKEDFWHEYEEVQKKFENEIRLFWQLDNSFEKKKEPATEEKKVEKEPAAEEKKAEEAPQIIEINPSKNSCLKTIQLRAESVFKNPRSFFKNLVTKPCSFFKNLVTKPWKFFCFLAKFLFNRLVSLFNLHSKILILRCITYAIPIFLFIFHFCEFFNTNSQKFPSWISEFSCKICASENPKNDPTSTTNSTQTSSEFLTKKIENPKNDPTSTTNSTQNSSEFLTKKEEKAYLYFHLALATALLIAYQQLRNAISEINIKKNLIEVYRHRKLVATNFHNLYNVNDLDTSAKDEIVKSAVKALFENEPSIYTNRGNAMPPRFLDINMKDFPKN